MRSIHRRMDHVISLHMTSCGFDDLVDKAVSKQMDLEEIIEKSLSDLADEVDRLRSQIPPKPSPPAESGLTIF